MIFVSSLIGWDVKEQESLREVEMTLDRVNQILEVRHYGYFGSITSIGLQLMINYSLQMYKILPEI